MNMNFIGVPINYGCDKEGVQYGPSKLRQHGLVDVLIKNGISYNDLGDIHVPKANAEEKLKYNNNIKYYEHIYKVCEDLADAVYNSLQNNQFPVILGGDHSLSIGSIAGASKYFEDLGVVWLDAHGDFNTDKITESKNCHGMPLAISCGYGDKKLIDLYEEKVKLKEDNVYHIGGRDFDVKEKELMNSTNINIYSKEEINKKGLENILKEIVEKCKKRNLQAIHISLDIDFLDGNLVPGTGTRVSDGYNIDDLKCILDSIFSTGLVRSLDFVEFNPRLDNNDKTLNICTEILEYILYKYKEAQSTGI